MKIQKQKPKKNLVISQILVISQNSGKNMIQIVLFVWLLLMVIIYYFILKIIVFLSRKFDSSITTRTFHQISPRTFHQISPRTFQSYQIVFHHSFIIMPVSRVKISDLLGVLDNQTRIFLMSMFNSDLMVLFIRFLPHFTINIIDGQVYLHWEHIVTGTFPIDSPYLFFKSIIVQIRTTTGMTSSVKQLLIFLKRNPRMSYQSSYRISIEFGQYLVRNHIRNRAYSYNVVLNGLQLLNQQRYIYLKDNVFVNNSYCYSLNYADNEFRW